MRLRLPTALALCVFVLGGQTSARTLQTPMSVDEFEAWSKGQTLDYWIDGTFFGSEMHLPGRQTMDSDPGGPCVAGAWHPDGDAICFVYDGSDTQHCWRFWRDGGEVFARSLSADPGSSPATVTLSPEPLACPGPEVGA
jgi:hypothetical protein